MTDDPRKWSAPEEYAFEQRARRFHDKWNAAVAPRPRPDFVPQRQPAPDPDVDEALVNAIVSRTLERRDVEEAMALVEARQRVDRLVEERGSK